MNYSNTIVGGMLSWLRGIANWAINLFNLSGERSLGVLTWFSRHWIGILILLILIGLVVDWLVWIIRWRPYWVWFRRKRVLIDDSDSPRRSRITRRVEDDWDGEEEEEKRPRRAKRTHPAARKKAETDFFAVDPSTALSDEDLAALEELDSFDDDSFRPGDPDDPDDLFTISSDDPDAINLWQDEVFNVSDIKGSDHPEKAKNARR